jgi:hypothetical protein
MSTSAGKFRERLATNVVGFLIGIGLLNLATWLIGSPWRFGWYR